MTNPTIHLSNISTGYAEVRREDDKILGTVERIDWPHEVHGIVEIEQRWEARTPRNLGIVNPYGFPTFPTRREAVAYLTKGY